MSASHNASQKHAGSNNHKPSGVVTKRSNNPSKGKSIGDKLAHLGSTIETDAKAIGSDIEHVASNIYDDAKKVGSTVVDDAKKVGSTVANDTRKVGHKVVAGVKALPAEVEAGFSEAGKAISGLEDDVLPSFNKIIAETGLIIAGVVAGAIVLFKVI